LNVEEVYSVKEKAVNANYLLAKERPLSKILPTFSISVVLLEMSGADSTSRGQNQYKRILMRASL